MTTEIEIEMELLDTVHDAMQRANQLYRRLEKLVALQPSGRHRKRYREVYALRNALYDEWQALLKAKGIATADVWTGWWDG